MAELTPSQTIGPFFYDGLSWAMDGDSRRDFGVPVVRIAGRVLDAEGDPVPDALVEVWQPDLAAAAWPGARLPGFQRADTRRAGRFEFWVMRPGKTATFASVTVFARGLLRGLHTRVYVPVSGPDTADVPREVPTERARTLVARAAGPSADTYEWDIVLQGTHETVFFEF
ncbi:MAG: protocatechuate 3,4-dioxygenase subunit alpha [Betaproteobacteria bacterium]|nr:protocatechuate 3,4-dioxygenase subunit alpha [Betaproteobacteria bacterium]